MVDTLKVGDEAPDFTLPDINLHFKSLKNFLSRKTVLAFFVSAFTNTCTMEMCAFRDSMARLIGLDAQVVGISVNDPFSNRAFAQKNKLPFPILSDYNREAINAYGVKTTDFSGLNGYTVAKRSIFIIDQNGIIRYVWTTEDPAVAPDYEEIEKALQEIK